MIGELKRTGAPWSTCHSEIEKFDSLPPARAEGSSAFVSIMEGCSKYCTFCVVPYTRGDEVSRGFDSVMERRCALSRAGRGEITLLGQNVNAYAGGMATAASSNSPR
jgi:tRNA-2-methylthio-N6-dimethylallyladenosine synthase